MDTPLIAVGLKQDKTVSPHAGRALVWRVYAVDGTEPEHVWDLELTACGCLHEWHVRGDGNRHPLHMVDVAIAGSAGDGVIKRLAERNTILVTTTERDPFKAVRDYLSGYLAVGAPHEEALCLNPEHRADRL